MLAPRSPGAGLGSRGREAAAPDARPCGGRASSRPVRVRSAPAGAWGSPRRRRSGSGQSGLPQGARRRTEGVRARPGLGLGAAPLQAPAPPRPPRRARRPSPAPARRAAATASPRGLRRSGRRRALGALRPVSRAAAPRPPTSRGDRRAPPAALGTRPPPTPALPSGRHWFPCSSPSARDDTHCCLSGESLVCAAGTVNFSSTLILPYFFFFLVHCLPYIDEHRFSQECL